MSSEPIVDPALKGVRVRGLDAALLYGSLGTAFASLVILVVLVPALSQAQAAVDKLVQIPVYALNPVPRAVTVPVQRPAASDPPIAIAAWCMATLNGRAFDDDDAVWLLQVAYRADSADARRVALRFIGLSVGMHQSTARAHQYSRAMLDSLDIAITARISDPEPHVQASAIIAMRRTGFIRRPNARYWIEWVVNGHTTPHFLRDEAIAALNGTAQVDDDTTIDDVGELDIATPPADK